MEKELISIIVPVYNVEPYLNRCIDSIVKQTHKSLDIILVDDGSPDNCALICDDWANKDERITVIHKENGGLSDARNCGLKCAKGNYIAFVDSDDWIAPKMYERLLKSIIEEESDIAACTVEMVWSDNSKHELLTVQENDSFNNEKAQEFLLNETKLKHPVWYKLYKRQTVNGLFFETGKYHEDVFWSYQAIGNATKVSIIDYVGYYYYQREDSIMGQTYSTDWKDYIDAVCERHKYIIENYPKLERIARISIIQNCIYHSQMSYKYLSGEKQTLMLSYLKKTHKSYKVYIKDYSGVDLKQGIWLFLSKISLKYTCLLKNHLGIGT